MYGNQVLCLSFSRVIGTPSTGSAENRKPCGDSLRKQDAPGDAPEERQAKATERQASGDGVEAAV